ncbi:tyrosine-type recombinase/integrase [Chloroflexota bacterium]
MTPQVLLNLYAHYPQVIQEMETEFTSHKFILKLAKHYQTEYIEALHHYRNNPTSEHPTPFKIVHGFIAKRLHAHLCRHTYATNFLNHKCDDVFRLQQILGHTTPEMVRRYVHYASTQNMINGRPSSPMDHTGIRRLNGYRVDQVLSTNHKRSGKDSFPEYNDRGMVRQNDR